MSQVAGTAVARQRRRDRRHRADAEGGQPYALPQAVAARAGLARHSAAADAALPRRGRCSRERRWRGALQAAEGGRIAPAPRRTLEEKELVPQLAGA